jgi:hypothetical protein
MEIFFVILSFLYASVGIIGTIAFAPTIRDLIKKIPSANINSYILWTFCGCVTFSYALFILKDFLAIVVTFLNFFCCSLALFLALRLKYSKKKK